MQNIKINYPEILNFSTKKDYKKFIQSLSQKEQEKVVSWHSPAPLLYFYTTHQTLNTEDLIAITRVAANPENSEALLSILYKYALQFSDPQAAIQILHHPQLSESFILNETEMWKKNVWSSVDGYGETISAVALSHPSVSQPVERFYSTIKNIHWGNNLEKIETYSLRKNPKSLFTQEEVFLQCLLLPQINTSPQILHALFLLANTSLLNSSEGKNMSTIQGGGYNPFDWVSEKVIHHPNCAEETILRLFELWENTPKSSDNRQGYNSSLLEHYFSVESLKKIILELLAEENCYPALLKQACWSESVEIRKIASQHKNCPEEDAVAAVLLPSNQDSLFL